MLNSRILKKKRKKNTLFVNFWTIYTQFHSMADNNKKKKIGTKTAFY